MSVNRVCSSFFNQGLKPQVCSFWKRNINTSVSLAFRATPCLLAEPLKKKKKVDPMVVRAREERRKRKIEKQIRRLEKNARQLKPIEEATVPFELIDDKKARSRNINVAPEVVEYRELLRKNWTRSKLVERLSDVQLLDRMMYSQQKALDQLRLESEELYQAAVQIDSTLFPLNYTGPVETPAQDYESPDGEYLDISKKW